MKLAAQAFFLAVILFNVGAGHGSDATGSVTINLARDGDFISVNILNRTPEKVSISKLFTQNPAYGVLQFKIASGGHEHAALVPLNEDIQSRSTYVNLSPYDVYGHEFSIDIIRDIYGVSDSCFNISVSYKDKLAGKYDAFSGDITSKEISICQGKKSKKGKKGVE